MFTVGSNLIRLYPEYEVGFLDFESQYELDFHVVLFSVCEAVNYGGTVNQVPVLWLS